MRQFGVAMSAPQTARRGAMARKDHRATAAQDRRKRHLNEGPLKQFESLVSDVRREGERRLKSWEPLLSRPAFRPSAANLAHYLALRSQDLRPLQIALSERGLSSLGRCEAHVLQSLTATGAALQCIAGDGGGAFPAPGWMEAASRQIEAHSVEVFGEDPTGPRSRIMVTVGAAQADEDHIHALIAAGADCFRINCAHDGPEVWEKIMRHVRLAAKSLNRDCRVLMDLAGPKIRIAQAAGPGKLRAKLGDEIFLQSAIGPRAPRAITITSTHPGIAARLSPGQSVSIDDGKLECVVQDSASDGIRLRVSRVRPKGVKLRAGKGLNYPGLDLDLPPLTKKDLSDLDYVVAHADIVGFSFVQRPEDIALLQEELQRRLADRPLPPLVIKVETRLALANLPELIVAAAGRQPAAVMIARGDLAVELGLEQLSETQEQLLWLCEAAHIPVVWATQVLDELLKTGAPSRAETTDATMAQRAECVMLNKGAHAIDAVRFLDNILHRMDKHVAKKSPLLGPLSHWTQTDENEASRGQSVQLNLVES
jgi:pyruvate kinase